MEPIRLKTAAEWAGADPAPLPDAEITEITRNTRTLQPGALFVPLLTVIAVTFGWFPASRPGAWLLFLGIALAVFAAMTLGFELYFRIAGRRYDGMLGQCRKEHEAE